MRQTKGRVNATYERGRDYGLPRQRMTSKQFEPGDRVRFRADKSLGTVIRAHDFNVMVRDDNGDTWQVTTADIIHSQTLTRKKNPRTGFTYHGSTGSLLQARKLSKKIPGSFIHTTPEGRYYILKPKKTRNHALGVRSARNPNMQGAVLIYERCLRIEAVKMRKHQYGGKESPAGQKYFHDFTTKNARIYGLPNGDLLIKGSR